MAFGFNNHYDERNVTIPGDDWEEPQRPRWQIILKALIVFLILAIIGVFAYVFYILTSISADPLSFGPLAGRPDGRTNILILGVGDPGHAGGELADTNMVLSLDYATNRAAFISLPRDLRVSIPGYGRNKINQANALGGPKLAVATVEQTLDIPIHYYMQTDFSGLKQAVDAVGGIDVEVKELLYDPEYPCDDNQYKSCGFELHPGSYHIDGTTALKYVRCRKGTCGNDFGRALRQQEVLQKVEAKAFDPSFIKTPFRLQRLSVAFQSNVRTDLSVNDIINLGLFWRKVEEGSIQNVVFSTRPDGYLISATGSSDLLPRGGDFDEIQEVVLRVFDNPENAPAPID